MTISIEFETIIVYRAIIELRFKGGWKTWLKKYSQEDDGELSRISAMSGHNIAATEKRIQKAGLLAPLMTETTYQYRDYFVYGREHSPHQYYKLALGIPNWLTINEPLLSKMSNFEIEKLPEGTLKSHPAYPTFDFNSEATIT